ncbi:MAG: radical SAM/SPASM domain-containing protein [Elusimicrobiota bacterium]
MTAKRFAKAYIEIGNACNIRCGFCPEVRRPPKLMTREFFAKVLEQAAPLVECAFLHLMGEPLAHPEFPEFVEICGRVRLPVHIATNGTLLTEDRAAALLSPVVRQVSFSLHSLEAGLPGSVDAHWDRIVDFTNRALSARPDLFINYRLWNLPRASAEPPGAFLRRIREAFGVDMGGPVDVRSRKGRRITGRLCLHLDTRFEWPSPGAPTRSECGTCRGLVDHFGVLADGTVVPCCLDSEGSIPLGDLKTESLAEILSSPRSRDMAEGFASGRLVEDLCRRCSFISRFERRTPAGARARA